MGRRIDLKLSTVFILTSLFIFSASSGGSYAFEHVLNDENVIETGIKVGPVDVGGLTKQEASEKLEDAIASWQKQSVIMIQGGKDQQEKEMPGEIYVFDVASSIAKAVESGLDSSITVTLNTAMLNDELKQSINQDVYDALDFSRVERDLLLPAQTLEQGEFTYFMLDYAEPSSQAQKVVASAAISSKDAPKLKPYFDSQKEFILAPRSTFSILGTFESLSISDESAKELSMIASVLYKAVLNTNFVIVERFTSRELPSYVELGFESRVTPGKLDLKVYNPNQTPYTITFDVNQDNLSVDIKGSSFLFTYEIETMDKTTFDPKTVVQYSSLPFGEKRVKEQGKSGHLIRVYRNELDSSRSMVGQSLISEDFYPPVHQVEEWSLLQPSREDETEEPQADADTVEPSNGGERQEDGSQDTNQDDGVDHQQDDSIWFNPDEVQKGF